jgi:hypothetical protein
VVAILVVAGAGTETGATVDLRGTVVTVAAVDLRGTVVTVVAVVDWG